MWCLRALEVWPEGTGFCGISSLCPSSDGEHILPETWGTSPAPLHSWSGHLRWKRICAGKIHRGRAMIQLQDATPSNDSICWACWGLNLHQTFTVGWQHARKQLQTFCEWCITKAAAYETRCPAVSLWPWWSWPKIPSFLWDPHWSDPILEPLSHLLQCLHALMNGPWQPYQGLSVPGGEGRR